MKIGVLDEEIFDVDLLPINGTPNVINFAIKGTEGLVEVQMYNSLGGLVLENEFIIKPKNKVFSIATENLIKGEYFVNFRQEKVSKGIEIKIK